MHAMLVPIGIFLCVYAFIWILFDKCYCKILWSCLLTNCLVLALQLTHALLLHLDMTQGVVLNYLQVLGSLYSVHLWPVIMLLGLVLAHQFSQ